MIKWKKEMYRVESPNVRAQQVWKKYKNVCKEAKRVVREVKERDLIRVGRQLRAEGG